MEVTASFALVKEETVAGKEPEHREYAVRIMHNSSASGPAKAQQSPACHQLYLEADYVGDRAEVYLDGKLVDDWFTNGEKWHIALKRFGFPSELTLRIYSTDCPIPNPYGNRVYYDLPVKEGCALTRVRVIPEYEIPVRENAE